MELSDDFRTRAERCLSLAREAPTLEAHTHWISMAQLWLSLAQFSEDQEESFMREGPMAIAAREVDGRRDDA